MKSAAACATGDGAERPNAAPPRPITTARYTRSGALPRSMTPHTRHLSVPHHGSLPTAVPRTWLYPMCAPPPQSPEVPAMLVAAHRPARRGYADPASTRDPASDPSPTRGGPSVTARACWRHLDRRPPALGVGPRYGGRGTRPTPRPGAGALPSRAPGSGLGSPCGRWPSRRTRPHSTKDWAYPAARSTAACR